MVLIYLVPVTAVVLGTQRLPGTIYTCYHTIPGTGMYEGFYYGVVESCTSKHQKAVCRAVHTEEPASIASDNGRLGSRLFIS